MTQKSTRIFQFLILAILLTSWSKTYAVGDPAAISMVVEPTPAYHSAPNDVYQKIAFTVENKGTLVNHESIQMTISLSNMYFAGGTFDQAVHIIRRSGTVNFNWTFVPSQGGGSESIIGTLLGDFPAGEIAVFEWNTLRVINPNPAPNPPNIGANLNWNVAATFNSNPANDQVAELVNSVPFVPTPVILSSFNVSENKCTADLNWTSASEKDLNYYFIQASIDGQNFQDVAKLKGKNKATSYSYNYANVVKGANYFRLRMVDYNSSQSYSEVRQATFSCDNGNLFTLYPNPATSEATISLNASPGQYTLELIDGASRIISTEKISFSKEIVSKNMQLPAGLSTGIYYVRLISSSGEKFTERMVIIK